MSEDKLAVANENTELLCFVELHVYIYNIWPADYKYKS